MTMPSSGPLNMGGTTSPVSVASELALGLTTTISMNQADVRTLAGVGGSGTSWSMNSLYGKSNIFTFTISSNQLNANLRTLAVAAGWNQSQPVQATVGSGVYIYSTSTASAALTINGSWPGGVTLINTGYIMGQGGNGGAVNAGGASGGIAITLGVSCTINNTNASAYIGGGGGGGGAGDTYGGGGGGGAGGGGGGASPAGAGGTGGGLGGSGNSGANVAGNSPASGGGGGGGAGGGGGGYGDASNPRVPQNPGGGGGGGGRIFPGAGGAAGKRASNNIPTGGAGGSANGGGGGTPAGPGGGGGGGWGASGGSSNTGFSGSVGGKAVALNGYSVTWTSGDTARVYGSVS